MYNLCTRKNIDYMQLCNDFIIGDIGVNALISEISKGMGEEEIIAMLSEMSKQEVESLMIHCKERGICNT